MKIRIVSDGRLTHIFNAETGEELKDCINLKITHESGDIVVAEVTQRYFEPELQIESSKYSMLKAPREKTGEIPKIVEIEGLQVTIDSTDEECECFAEALGWPASVLKDARDRMKAASDKMLFKLEELAAEAFYSEAFMKAISEEKPQEPKPDSESERDRFIKAISDSEMSWRSKPAPVDEPKPINFREWT